MEKYIDELRPGTLIDELQKNLLALDQRCVDNAQGLCLKFFIDSIHRVSRRRGLVVVNKVSHLSRSRVRAAADDCCVWSLTMV